MHAVDDRKRSGRLCIIILQHLSIAIANKFHPSDSFRLVDGRFDSLGAVDSAAV